MRGERGFALVITLIVTALLVALVVEFVNETYVDASHSHNFVASQQSGVLAESGAQLGRSLLELELGSGLPGGGHPEYSSLLDTWAQPLQWGDETGTLTVTIEEESGKLNLNSLVNTADSSPFQAIARNLFLNLKLPPEVCDTIGDWVSPVDKAPRTNGAKSPYYNALKPSYDVKGSDLQTVEELGLVKGCNAETMTKLRRFVTVYDQVKNEPLHSTKININTAPPEVLTAIKGLTPSMVNDIVDYRKSKAIKTLSQEGLPATLPNFGQVLTCRGSVYRIHAEGKVGESVSVAEAVVRVSGSGSEILYWREY
jgi:general secretion pathway protein K